MVSTSCPAGDIIVLLGEPFIRGPPTSLCTNEFGATLHAAGITESDTQYDEGNTFQRCVAEAPKKALGRVRVHRLVFTQTEKLMDTSHHVREEQAKVTLGYFRDERRNQSKFLSKLSTCTTTAEDLDLQDRCRDINEVW